MRLQTLAKRGNPGLVQLIEPGLPWLFIDWSGIHQKNRYEEDRRLIWRSGCVSNPGSGWVRVRRQTAEEFDQMRPCREMLEKWAAEWRAKSPDERAAILKEFDDD